MDQTEKKVSQLERGGGSNAKDTSSNGNKTIKCSVCGMISI